jgi:hypothetical protein
MNRTIPLLTGSDVSEIREPSIAAHDLLAR